MKRRQIIEVAMREIRTRGRSKGYRTITLIMLLLAIGAPIATLFLPDPTDDLRDVTIGITAGAPAAFEVVLGDLSEGSFDLATVDLGESTTEQVRQQLAEGTIDVALRAPATLIWDATEDSAIARLMTAALQRAEALRRADELGIDVSDLAAVFEPVEVNQEFVETSTNTEGVRRAVAFFGLFLAFLLPQIFGQFTMMSVVEEKSTRVVEVLLSQIRPGTLLAGKIIGLCALAVVQLGLIVFGLFVSLLVTDAFEVPASVWQFVPMMAVSVFGGLVIYTTLFALLGSLISRQEDQAQVLFPVFAPLMGGYFVGQAAILGNPESLLVKVLTWFPLTTPMMLPVRVALEAIGPLEIVTSLALMALAVVILFKLAGRIYEFTLLRTGSRVGWAELVRLSRGSVLD